MLTNKTTSGFRSIAHSTRRKNSKKSRDVSLSNDENMLTLY